MMALARLIELGVVPPIQQICCLKKPGGNGNKRPPSKSADKDEREPLKDEKASSTLRVCLNCGRELQSRIIDESEVYMYYPAKPQASTAHAGKSKHCSVKKTSQINSTGNGDSKNNGWASPCKMGVRELLIDFFYHYSTTYKPFKDVISVRLGTTSASREHTTAMFNSSIFNPIHGEALANQHLQPPFVVEDPIETHINCARILSSVAFGYRSEFFKAYTHLLHNDWDGFMEEWRGSDIEECNYKHMDWAFYSILCELSKSAKSIAPCK
ncbi:hypothetical protein H4219_002026 [Mycoemilia scoparia]|uniref:PAP-associated domain-containing protein n=1 Tax=Mycoemilia scoparia TaxID=417184 RepID=A0A9W7ZYG4_9FUNG|nr:hypothetical protein H4219_002026 [Mycoemilia scoparia]